MSRGKCILVLIIAVAILTRLYGLDFELLSLEQKTSVLLSVSAGVLSVVGLYFLVKELFDEKLAAISSFLLAVSFWHVLVSKLGAKDIFTSFALIFAFYFIWHGLKYNRIFNFFLAGLFLGAGFYAGKGFFLAPVVVLLVFWNYWDYIKKDFSLSKYEQTKSEVLAGFSLLMLTTLAVALPVGFYLWQNPPLLLSADNSIFARPNPFTQIRDNLGWVVDKILLIEFGSPTSRANLISWPLSIFFAIGFIKELIHWLKRKHGHFSVAHTFIFSWLFVMLIPTLLSSNPLAVNGVEPSVIGLSIILPLIMLLSAKGLWWVIEKLNKWDRALYPLYTKHWGGLDTGPFLAMIALLLSIAILEIAKLI
ncbi:MAG: glycosyltransferase family 39 protein [Candidatus Yanofskybacteria bacterium]|nr:glycosyltransferase family 39 protein [Candidatus Yanofskybacteria bacterium]